jgi:hypothetical protein
MVFGATGNYAFAARVFTSLIPGNAFDRNVVCLRASGSENYFG